jgi:hypothetical protein
MHLRTIGSLFGTECLNDPVGLPLASGESQNDGGFWRRCFSITAHCSNCRAALLFGTRIKVTIVGGWPLGSVSGHYRPLGRLDPRILDCNAVIAAARKGYE